MRSKFGKFAIDACESTVHDHQRHLDYCTYFEVGLDWIGYRWAELGCFVKIVPRRDFFDTFTFGRSSCLG